MNTIEYDIRNDFSDLREFALSLSETFDNMGAVILDNRNVIKKIEIPQGTFVIKDFKGMYFFNRLGYSLFSRSKAEKSFRNSQNLNKRGISTPAHVGWINYYNLGLLKRSFFISVYHPYETLRETLKRNLNNKPHQSLLYHHLLKFIIKLHKAGVYHDDFSLTNMLVKPTKEGYQFSLVDLNRIRFMKVNFRQGLQNFGKLEIPEADLEKLIRAYAVEAGESPDSAVDLFWADNKRRLYLRRFRKTLRRYTLTPLENFYRKGISRYWSQPCNALLFCYFTEISGNVQSW
ncbi:hypothetical protein DYBT9275_02803 [Dyadobacter sp. CECT 9275]|uniref:Lipopolysaccharide kinase (Kdo/WaaP) family protein n=1 Tax=Dyadobacter helix TaxID=2822344 RepID=A0A916JCS0_9BACT|nr:lipopolysaccharide kinase InaA family protein [Dyadobacter sp. CECT 9275]CAG5002081.1 hypothetical protein DYBT9275_02803 [Dyadobacter sp. CECT 9275]